MTPTGDQLIEMAHRHSLLSNEQLNIKCCPHYLKKKKKIEIPVLHSFNSGKQ